MIGEHASCPTSGVSPATEIHPGEQSRPERVSESDESVPETGLEESLRGWTLPNESSSDIDDPDSVQYY